ncbi:hypothetical protein D3C76_1472630 [compost metagenome]
MFDAFTNITQANADVATFDLGDVETDSVVDHRQPHRLFAAAQRNGYVPGPGVALDIGQAFLDDAKQRDRCAVDQLAVEFIVVIGHGKAAALFELSGQLTDCRRQAERIEQR